VSPIFVTDPYTKPVTLFIDENKENSTRTDFNLRSCVVWYSSIFPFYHVTRLELNKAGMHHQQEQHRC